MSRTFSLRGLAGLAFAAGLALANAAAAQNCDCATGCCPPHFKYRFEGAPKIKFKRGCPKPICDPCHLPHYGYYPTCWQPWPFPPNWDHCPVPPPDALVPSIPPKRFRPEAGDSKETPPPRKVEALPPATLPPLAIEKVMPRAEPPAELPPAAAVDRASAKPTYPEPLPMGPPAAQETPIPMPPPLPQMLPRVEEPAAAPLGKEPESQELAPANARADLQRPRSVSAGSGPAMRMVNSRRILLDYDLSDVPAPKNSMLELWYTQDGRRWHKDQTQVKSGAPYVVEVGKEGSYGFMMVARGPGEKCVAPSPGETPQVWVEVDWSRPLVNLVDVKVSLGPAGRTLTLAWTAADNNLAPKPITLSYAHHPEGPWKSFAAGVENGGRHVWQVPANITAPLYLRLEAFDLVGNTGVAQTPTPVHLP